MKKDKNFTYYGMKRVKIRRYIEMLNKQRFSSLYILIPLVLLGLIFDIETNFSFSFSVTGGILSIILLVYLVYLVTTSLFYFECLLLDKYYFKKRKELLDKYIAEKGWKRIIIGDDHD